MLDGRDPGRYAWLAADDFGYEVTALVADTAHSLSALRLAWGDAAGAMDAARAGLRLAFDDEMLWRDLLRGAHATGKDEVLRAVVDEVSARVALDEVMSRMARKRKRSSTSCCRPGARPQRNRGAIRSVIAAQSAA